MKNEKIKKSTKLSHKKNNFPLFIKKKIEYYQKIIIQTILIVQKYKTLDILGASELNVCMNNLKEIFNELYSIKKNTKKITIDKLQEVNNALAIVFRTFGTEKMEDLITVVFGKDFLQDISMENELYEIINQYVHPIGYKLMGWNNDHNPSTKNTKLAKNRIVEDFMIVETAENFDCFDLARTSSSFQTKVYGIKVAIHNSEKKKTLIIYGIVDDIPTECINNPYLNKKKEILEKNEPKDSNFDHKNFKSFLLSLTIKELLIYSDTELYHRYSGYIMQTQLIKGKTISQIVKEFLNAELYKQRTILIQLLIKYNDPEFQYLAYLLYDLLSNESSAGNVDTIEQTILFDSFPWTIKTHFRNAMKTTIKYTKNLSNYDTTCIPIEQQICLMKANDTIKEKAMNKLKEVKAKSEDSGSKARQYLNALLKIPFGIHKDEPILKKMSEIKKNFKNLIYILNIEDFGIPIKEKYSSLEIFKTAKKIKNEIVPQIENQNLENLIKQLCSGKRIEIINNIHTINLLIKKHKLKGQKLCHSGKKCQYMKDSMKEFVHKHKDNVFLYELYKKFNKKINNQLILSKKNLKNIDDMSLNIVDGLKDIKKTLDISIHGHENAKRQLERIIGQWINGESTGYCFGFEGPPGLGKTSLAKNGLAFCLKDVDGKPRPFTLIAMGGSSNASTLAGHNYTYVGSTWGRIVDILIETKCMNPIIFIDELDKVSRTEHGKEIIGILTHLVDGTQNNCFQDKYFSGINLDLSKALIIFSYNDPSLIDSILLDRIHRIQFKTLSLEEKIIIVADYLLPEIFKKVGLENIIQFDNEIIQYLIQTYTNEAGVRKLKEILYEIISEINLEILSMANFEPDIPYKITIQNIEEKYLKDREKIRYTTINKVSKVGIINGLWANSIGLGGIIAIECKWMPSSNFLELKLTGRQGDVMKESMNVAKTLAWELTPASIKKKLKDKYKKDNLFGGIHIHCPEGGTPKDGPSAGTAITIALFSLFNNKKIKNNIAITGEIRLQGNITAIGGLDCKINGGVRAGVNEFIFPEENIVQFNKFLEKYGEKPEIKKTIFHKVNKIKEVMKLIFVDK